jgi:hypothetical protein
LIISSHRQKNITYIIFFLLITILTNAKSTKKDPPEKINILEINTYNKPIVRSEKIPAHLNVNKKQKKILISIKKRGSSSRFFAKKQYSIKTILTNRKKHPISLIELPKGSHWVLYGPFVDRSYLRNALAYTIGKKFENKDKPYFAPKWKFVWLNINKQEKGLYMLIEKIKKDKKRIKIPAYKKHYSFNKMPFIAEISSRAGDFKTKNNTSIRFRYPSTKDIDSLRKYSPLEYYKTTTIIRLSLEELEAKLLTSGDTLERLKKTLNIESAIDYMIIQEIFKNIDGYRRSVYFYRNSKGMFTFGPIWDFNLAMGNVRLHGSQSPKKWLVEHNTREIPHAFYFKKLWSIKTFRLLFKNRYFALRQNIISDANITQTINTLTQSIKGYCQKDDKLWNNKRNSIDNYFLNTKTKGYCFEDHKNILYTWMLQRLKWIDKNIKYIK